MARRTREFDRSNFFGDLFSSTVPHNQVCMKTTDEWRSNRKLMAETMSPGFLQNVAGPQVHDAFSSLVEVWKRKEQLAQDHPFSAAKDVEETMLDAMYSVAFGSSLGAIESQRDLISSLQQLDGLPTRGNAIAIFPRAPTSAAYNACITIADSSEIPLRSPFGRTHHYLATRVYPTLRSAIKLKDRLIRDKLDKAWHRYTSSEDSEDDIRCAADLIVEREVKLAKKEGRAPQHDSRTVSDELFGFLEAGHDTTATTAEWGIKYLTQHQDVQHKLRDSLRGCFAAAWKSGNNPTAVDIAKTQTHYLDAFVEETLRCGSTASANIRVATQDTEIFGYHIPKGTDVFMVVSVLAWTYHSRGNANVS